MVHIPMFFPPFPFSWNSYSSQMRLLNTALNVIGFHCLRAPHPDCVEAVTQGDMWRVIQETCLFLTCVYHRLISVTYLMLHIFQDIWTRIEKNQFIHGWEGNLFWLHAGTWRLSRSSWYRDILFFFHIVSIPSSTALLPMLLKKYLILYL